MRSKLFIPLLLILASLVAIIAVVVLKETGIKIDEDLSLILEAQENEDIEGEK